MRIKGFAEAQDQLKELGGVANALYGDIVSVKYEPTDLESVEHAIPQMGAMVDA